MSDLVDRESSSRAPSVAMPSSAEHLGSRDAELAREYGEYRDAIMAMLAADFPREADHEGLYQDAWAELLALEARGETVRSRRALLKTIAWRRAADAAKKRRPEALDPASSVLRATVDEQPLPDEQAQVRLDADALRLVVESLDDQQAAVLKLRFDQDLPAREVQERMGIGEKRLEAIVTAAYKKIAAQLSADDGGQSRWERRQRSLLLACELGIASARQRRRAQAMVDRDPVCRAMLHAIRTNLGDVAAVLPMPVLVEEQDRLRRVASATGRLDEWVASARQLAERMTGRGMPDSGVLEQGAVGGASVGTGALAAKVVVACLTIGGGTAVCVNLADRLHDRPARAATPPPRSAKVVEPDRAHAQVVRRPKTITTTTKTTAAKAKKKAVESETPVSSPKSTPSASPAPQGSTEFGPGALGSTRAPKQPAAAPQNGGGEFLP